VYSPSPSIFSSPFTHVATYKNLNTIKQDLHKIAIQSKLLIILFKGANKAKIDRCMELLKNSLDHWDVRHVPVLSPVF
jgi:hypothetical protein